MNELDEKIDLYLKLHNYFKFTDIYKYVTNESVTFSKRSYIYQFLLNRGYLR